ncbi:5,10-methylenetetrahydrofolate reductase [Haematobia irritans]|uniref:5,10-methylenetetrahydrofolate reductase n=1 Tax=Haematobia irritans TaxID=7368 RepID=UPI003F50095C
MQVKWKWAHCTSYKPLVARSFNITENFGFKKLFSYTYRMGDNLILASSSSLTTTTGALGAHVLPPPTQTIPNKPREQYQLNIHLPERVQQTTDAESTAGWGQLRNVINDKVKNKQFFYGLEIMARTYQPNVVLDYKNLDAFLPLFTSIVWLGLDYWNVENLEDIGAINVARKLDPHMRIMPHFSCYRLTEDRLRDFLNLNFSNVLSIRGDYYDADQTYKHSSELVATIRSIRGDSITIAVAGYPEGHPESKSLDEDMDNMVKKVSAGADFIITQICFSSEFIIDFIKRCRLRNIKIPILVGIFVPDNLHMLETMLRITKIKMPSEELEEYRQYYRMGKQKFTEFAMDRAVDMITTVLQSSEVDVYGLQFFSMNKFENIPKVLNKILENNNEITK